MHIRLTGWMVVSAVLALSAGALAGSAASRRNSAMDELSRAQAALQERDALVASLTADLDRLRDQVDASKMDVSAAEAALRTSQHLLNESTDQIRQLEGTIAQQRQDMRMLAGCLRGAMYALQMMADGNNYGAMHYVLAVDGECRAAQQLLNLQSAN